MSQNNLDIGQELQSPSSTLIYNRKPYSFESEPVVAFRTQEHTTDPVSNNIYKYNVFLKPKDKWIREKFNVDGELEEKYEYDYLSNVLTDETIYQYDFNNDGSIGAVVEATYNGNSHSESFYKISTGDYILGTNSTSIGQSPSQQKLLQKDNKPFEFGHEPKAFYVSNDMMQVKVFSEMEIYGL